MIEVEIMTVDIDLKIFCWGCNHKLDCDKWKNLSKMEIVKPKVLNPLIAEFVYQTERLKK